ncbi:hypothetical protein [Piscinibacter terrae]|uniref:Uncharacterized protein n=1 Tax=Piscinibacter terrae TaxID=2496871 RepID=A0A3N7HR32_9BURK|nr:hypothetical protein [Albitalea terrae]RQP23646.1 hypothetical protein DZC73_16070 [Albitalea terrae]
MTTLVTLVPALTTALQFGGVRPGSLGPDISVDPSIGPPAISFKGAVRIDNVPSSTTVRAHISGDSGVFQVRDLIVLDWILEEVDPGELPPFHRGPLPKVRVQEVAATAPGNASISIQKGQTLVVRVQYAAPSADASATAMLNIEGDGWALQQVAVSLFTADVETTLGIPTLTVFQGQTAHVPMLVKSVAGPAVDVRYEQSRTQLHTGVSIPPALVHLDRHGFTTAPLTLSIAPDAPLGSNTIFVDQFGFERKTLSIPIRIEPVPQQVLAERAREKIQAQYVALGGAASALGLPIDPAMPLASAGKSFLMNFRGGTIRLDDADGVPSVQVEDRITLRFVALECQIRQEKTDEMYGSVSILVPGIQVAGSIPHETVKFPDEGDGTLDFGPDGLRITQMSQQLYSGPPTDLVIGCHLIEHDSGDVGEVKQAIRESVDALAKTLSGVAGVDAEHLTSQQDFLGKLSEFVLNAISNFLGASDDAYDPGATVLHWQDLKARNFQRKILSRSDDPRQVAYTHSLVLSGRDDGGDVGRYAFYFEVS